MAASCLACSALICGRSPGGRAANWPSRPLPGGAVPPEAALPPPPLPPPFSPLSPFAPVALPPLGSGSWLAGFLSDEPQCLQHSDPWTLRRQPQEVQR
eukprot:44529-Pyramimonas_sp.AAC.1